LLLARVGAVGDGLSDPAFQPGQLLISRRQGSGSHQHAAQVLDRLAGRQLVQGPVAERPLSGLEVTQGRWRAAAVEP